MRVIDAENARGNFFGGDPFSVNWDFGGGTSPSKLTINVVNERGQYSSPRGSLGYNKVQSVSIGSFEFKGYLVSYSIKESPTQGKILELVYVDKFVDLDKYTIGLKGKWGESSSGKLIIVGKRYHPCDIDLDSTVEYQEQNGQYDPCDPCPEMPKLKYELACSPLLEEFNIFETYYTFNELIDAIPFDVTITNANQYKEYKSNHIGPLSSVLGSWCSDLGMAYFWDPFEEKLVFISRNKSLSIQDPGIGDDIIDKEEGATMENSYSRGVVGYLGLQGGIKDYSCVKSTVENLACLKLGDLAADGTYNSFSGGENSEGSGGEASEKYANHEAKEIAIALSYYSKDMRDAFLWFDHYGIVGPEELIKEAGEEGEGASAGKINNLPTFSFFGNMRVLAVYAQGEEGDDSSSGFSRIDGTLSVPQRDTYNLPLGKDDKASGSNNDANYYFFVAQVNEELYRKEQDMEAELSRNFLGKYWYSEFDTTIPNATNRTTEVDVQGPDGAGAWYYKGSQLKNLSIFNFGHEEGSFISKLDDELPSADKEYLRKINKYIGDPKEKEFFIKGFILLDRESKWEPTSEQSKWYNSLFDWYAAQIPIKLDDGRPRVLFDVYPDAVNDPNIRLYIARKGNASAFKIRKTVKVGHPQESRVQKSFTESYQSALGEFVVEEICKWGISEKSRYAVLEMGSPVAIKIHTPVESFQEVESGSLRQDPEKILYDVTGTGRDAKIKVPTPFNKGYDAVVKASSRFKAFLPKYEKTYLREPDDTDTVANVSYLYAQVSEENLNYWFRKNQGNKASSSRQDCMPNDKNFETYMQKVHEFTSYTMSSPQDRYSFKMAGLFPQKYGILEGLSNVSINITDDGIFTNYVLEDKIIQPPSINVIEQYLRNNGTPQRTIGDGRLPIDPWKLRKMMGSVVNV
jgi:hypothetical protein